jgi:protein SCO1/2
MKNLRWILIGGGALLVAASVFFLGLQAMESSRAFRGSAIGTPVPPAMNFELQRTDGTPFVLSEQHGKVVLIYTGFTHCLDFCPGTLAKFNQIAESLGEDAAQVEFIFVTVDPERDSPDIIANYVSSFGANIVGLTGTMEQLEKVWVGYGAGRILEQPDANGNYEVSHSTRVWVIDKNGLLRITFPFEMTASDMTHDVQILLAE